MSDSVLCPACGKEQMPGDGARLDGVCASCTERGVEAGSGIATEREDASSVGADSQNAASGETVGAHATSSPDEQDASPDDSSRLDETVTQPDTVGAMDTNAPDLADAISESWNEGVLVANRFRLLKFIGQGGMGKVYLAQDETLKRSIALKRIPQEIIFDVDARDDLRLEANRLLDLAHENIVRVHTYYDGPTWPFFAMEFLQGPTLKKLLHERKREKRAFSAKEVLAIARQVGRGLAHAHGHKIVHRDLKPANLMLARAASEEIGDKDTVKITDFGISRVVADGTLRQTGNRSGTLPYMSPEQFRGEPSTPRSDIYSLSCTLYELATGAPPFTTGDIGYQIQEIEPKIIETLPRPMALAIARGLAKNPADRFDSVEDFIAALEGDARVSNRAFYRGLFSVGSKMAAGILFVALVLWGASKLYNGGGDTSGSDRNDGRGGNTASLVPGGDTMAPAERRKKIEEFSRWLELKLSSDLRTVVGRKEASRIHLGGPPRIDIDLFLSEEESPSGAAFLSRLVFQTARQDSDGVTDVGKFPGVSEAGIHRFKLARLQEGTYVLTAFLSPSGRIGDKMNELFRKSLYVDLTPPVFDVLPREPDLLVYPGVESTDVGAAREVFATFEDTLNVRLATSTGGGASDIAKAFYQEVSGESTSGEIEIDDPQNWQVPRLSPGEKRTLRVFAEDAAGQRSEKRDVVFHRHRMQIDRLGTVEVIGNIATLQGVFLHEGTAYPDLVFFVNGDEVDGDWRPISGESRRASDEPFVAPRSETDEAIQGGVLSKVAFEARVPLSKPNNTIDVRYAWKGRRARSFAQGGFLESVLMRAPNVNLSVPGLEPAEPAVGQPERPGSTMLFTKKNQLTLDGTVEPYFSALQILLVVHNDFGSSQEAVVVDPQGTGTSGKFQAVVDLEPGLQNVVAIECYARGESQELMPSPDPVTLYCDQDSPTGALTVQAAGGQLVVRIIADEPISSLRGRLVPTGGGSPPWKSIELPAGIDPEQLSFTWREPLPTESVTVHVELTDRAGNTSPLKEFFNPFLAAPARAGDDERAPAPRALGGGVVQIRSEFLREIDEEFKVCGPSRLELGMTEVSEYAWFLFLRAKDLRAVALGPGRKDFPAVIEDQHLKLLPEFVRWYEANAADGYAYSIPTPDQWLRGFTSARTISEAQSEIEAWFDDSDAGFAFAQPARYGQNKPSARGSRPVNQTPTELLDMESNLQEVVVDAAGGLLVIGGHNQLDDAEKMKRAALVPRKFDNHARQMLWRFTGLRLARIPKTEG